MGLHCIIEPAGTLMTGWELVAEDDHGRADLRNSDEASPADPHEADRTPPPRTRSKWELCEVG